MSKEKWAKRVPFIMLGIVFVIAFPWLVASHYWLKEGSLLRFLGDTVGGAFLAAAIVGLTTDLAIRLNWLREVFGVAFGYTLAPELRGHVNWMFQIPCLSTTHEETIEVIPIDGTNLVRVKNTIHRTTKNITNKTQPVNVGTACEEWFLHRTEHSLIKHFSLSYKGNLYTTMDESIRIKRVDKGWITDAPSINIGEGESFDVVFAIEEVLPANGVYYVLQGGAATFQPRIKVTVPESFESPKPAFVNGEQGEVEVIGPGYYKFTGILLPLQPIVVRWFRKSDLATWGNDG